MKIYRYEIEYKSYYDDTKVELREYDVVKQTDYWYFIYPTYYQGKLKKVAKNAYNTFAYDTKEKAKEHFIQRTKKRIGWFEFWIEECKKGLEIIQVEA